jgi:hypothetical protein
MFRKLEILKNSLVEYQTPNGKKTKIKKRSREAYKRV